MTSKLTAHSVFDLFLMSNPGPDGDSRLQRTRIRETCADVNFFLLAINGARAVSTHCQSRILN
jgi:hypothetical protein